MFYRGLGHEESLLVAAINFLMYLAMITDYIAICLWVKKHVNFALIYGLTTTVFLVHMFYLFIEDNIQMRVFLIRAYFMVISYACFFQIVSGNNHRNIGHKLAALFLLCLGLANATAFVGFLNIDTNSQGLTSGQYYQSYSTLIILSASPTLFSAAGVFYLLGLLLDKLKIEQENAQQDPLTGVYNRRGFDLIIESALKHSKRLETPLCIAIVDLDHFKSINDTYGHKAGDKVLVSLCTHFKHHLREIDSICRLGGEEFLILLSNCHLENAYQTIERIRTDLQSQRFIKKQPNLQVTASFGLCQANPDTDDLNSLYKRCDRLLYKAKSAGRNQTVKEFNNQPS
jgi:diguanylate cyclase (GGDEF)-like protein